MRLYRVILSGFEISAVKSVVIVISVSGRASPGAEVGNGGGR
jgi:hypothetical protein